MHPSPYRFLPVSLKLAVPGPPLALQLLCIFDIRLHWGKRSDTVCCCPPYRLPPGIAPGSLIHRFQADPPAVLMLRQIGNRCIPLFQVHRILSPQEAPMSQEMLRNENRPFCRIRCKNPRLLITAVILVITVISLFSTSKAFWYVVCCSCPVKVIALLSLHAFQRVNFPDKNFFIEANACINICPCTDAIVVSVLPGRPVISNQLNPHVQMIEGLCRKYFPIRGSKCLIKAIFPRVIWNRKE